MLPVIPMGLSRIGHEVGARSGGGSTRMRSVSREGRRVRALISPRVSGACKVSKELSIPFRLSV